MPDPIQEQGGPAFDEPLMSLLTTALAMERQMLGLLADLVSQTADPVLHKDLEHHLQETHEHIRNVEEVFGAFGKEPAAAPDPVLDGLRAAHRALIEETPESVRVLTVVATAAAAEHAEIARYEILRGLVEWRGNAHAVELVVRTLDQERQALKVVCESMHRILTQAATEREVAESAGNLRG